MEPAARPSSPLDLAEVRVRPARELSEPELQVLPVLPVVQVSVEVPELPEEQVLVEVLEPPERELTAPRLLMPFLPPDLTEVPELPEV